MDVNFKGLDVLPIFSPAEALEALKSSQPLRLKLNGRTQFSGSMNKKEDTPDNKSTFSGNLSLDRLRVNQLKLSRNLSGRLHADFPFTLLRMCMLSKMLPSLALCNKHGCLK